MGTQNSNVTNTSNTNTMFDIFSKTFYLTFISKRASFHNFEFSTVAQASPHRCSGPWRRTVGEELMIFAPWVGNPQVNGPKEVVDVPIVPIIPPGMHGVTFLQHFSGTSCMFFLSSSPSFAILACPHCGLRAVARAATPTPFRCACRWSPRAAEPSTWCPSYCRIASWCSTARPLEAGWWMVDGGCEQKTLLGIRKKATKKPNIIHFRTSSLAKPWNKPSPSHFCDLLQRH